MVEQFGEDFDCWEWFQADKEKILRNLARKNAPNGRPRNFNRRYNNLNPVNVPLTSKIPTERLEEILNLKPLGMFLYLSTETEPDFFIDQIGAQDDMERIIIYTRILVILCELELPGFHYDMLGKVASCLPLLEHYEQIVRKLCLKSFRTMWTDLGRVDNIISYMQTILLQAQRAGVLNESTMQILINIWTYLKNNNNPTIAERPICIDFLKQLEGLFSADKDVLAEPNPPAEIYPSLEEIKLWLEQQEDAFPNAPKLTVSYTSNTQYINSQRLLLRQQFLLPLRDMVRMLHRMRSLHNVMPPQIAFENVAIRLNKKFSNAHNSKLLFVDVAWQRNAAAKKEVKLNDNEVNTLSKLKNGSLLCLSTGYDFENLILLIVVGTDLKQLRRGYIAVTILRQFNIGNIYDKLFLMFETPVYFEPNHKAYRYLTNSNAINFPFSDYIVHGLTRTEPPAYLKQTQPPNVYKSQKFVNKLRKMPLSPSQLNAFESVLSTNFNLIRGPPGTGKTHLSLQLIRTMLKHVKFSAPIVVITYTNDSLDKFLLKLSAFTSSIVRLGCQSRLPEISKFNARANTSMVNPRLKRLYWMVNLQIKEDFQCLQSLYGAFNNTDQAYEDILEKLLRIWGAQEKLNSIRMIFQHYLIVKKNVLAMTTTCASRMNFIFRFLKSRIVFFEEAAEILEAHILPCLTPYTEHVIMIGDHMQLKPYISYTKGQKSSDVTQSLFERLIRWDFHVNVLNIQYRMHHAFAELLCPLIYQNLTSHKSVYKFPSVRSMAMNLYFLQHHELENQTHCASPCNEWEAQKVLEIVRHLIEVAGYKSKEVVVITPYTMQVESIKNKLSKKPKLKDIKITTVDSFQGLEADIVILSLVRSNKQGYIGFLADKNRICVAMSRARYGFYIIGNLTILSQKSLTWRGIQTKLIQQNAIGYKFPYDINNNNNNSN